MYIFIAIQSVGIENNQVIIIVICHQGKHLQAKIYFMQIKTIQIKKLFLLYNPLCS